MLSDLKIYNLKSITVGPGASAAIKTGIDTLSNSEGNEKMCGYIHKYKYIYIYIGWYIFIIHIRFAYMLLLLRRSSILVYCTRSSDPRISLLLTFCGMESGVANDYLMLRIEWTCVTVHRKWSHIDRKLNIMLTGSSYILVFAIVTQVQKLNSFRNEEENLFLMRQSLANRRMWEIFARNCQ